MRKIRLALIVLVVSLLFVACEEQARGYTLVETDTGIQRIFPPGTLELEHFLEDIDSLMYILENNFALLEVAYWAWGIDVWALADDARMDVLWAYEWGLLCEDGYLAILWANFFPLFGTGHFSILTMEGYEEATAWNSRFTIEPAGLGNMQLLTSPLALRFYEERLNDIDYAYERFVIALIDFFYGTDATDLYNRFFGSFGEFWGFELVYYYEYEHEYAENLVMEILEDGRIAYIHVGSFLDVEWTGFTREQIMIFNFYREIRDFEHLIIDLRGNDGGNPGYFIDVLFRPHLEEVVEIDSFHFFMDGAYIRRHGNLIFGDYLFENRSGYRPIQEIFEEHLLPDFYVRDLDRLSYGVVSRTRELRPNIAPFDFQVAFPGKIWMLTDTKMGSASQVAAWISMETDFATHVGATTGGAYGGGPRVVALLPNSGIAIQFDVFYLTDSRGRPLEAGTIPHHFNRPGMDALETTLALIAEGEY